MKALVKITYQDKITKVLHQANETVELSDERLAELEAKGYVVKQAPAKPKTTSRKKVAK